MGNSDNSGLDMRTLWWGLGAYFTTLLVTMPLAISLGGNAILPFTVGAVNAVLVSRPSSGYQSLSNLTLGLGVTLLTAASMISVPLHVLYPEVWPWWWIGPFFTILAMFTVGFGMALRYQMHGRSSGATIADSNVQRHERTQWLATKNEEQSDAPESASRGDSRSGDQLRGPGDR